MEIKVKMVISLGMLCMAPLSLAEPTAIQCGKLFDSASASMRGASTIVIEDNKISQVLDGHTTVANAKLIDLRSQTCSPGFIDMHVHLGQQSNPQSYSEGFRLNPEFTI